MSVFKCAGSEPWVSVHLSHTVCEHHSMGRRFGAARGDLQVTFTSGQVNLKLLILGIYTPGKIYLIWAPWLMQQRALCE